MRFPLTLLLIQTVCCLAVLPVSGAFALNSNASILSGQSSATGGVGIRLVDVPEATQDDPRARAYVIDRVQPGTELQRHIEVSNSTDGHRAVRIYSGGAAIADGGFVAGGDPSANVLTSWTSFDQTTVVLEAGAAAEVLVTIDVPLDASEEENYGVIWAEMTSAPAAGSTVIQAARVGIRMYLSVGPGNGAPADFAIEGLTSYRDEFGVPGVSATVSNTGGRALDLSGALSLAGGPAGLSAGPFPVEQSTTLAPGDTEQVSVGLDSELPNGPWDATLSLKSGLVEREASATITFPDAGVGETVAPDEPPVLLITLVSSGAVLLFLAAGTFWWLRRHKAVASVATRAAASVSK